MSLGHDLWATLLCCLLCSYGQYGPWPLKSLLQSDCGHEDKPWGRRRWTAPTPGRQGGTAYSQGTCLCEAMASIVSASWPLQAPAPKGMHTVSGFPLPKQETGPGSQLLEAPDSWASSWLQPACLGHMDMWGREPAPRKALSLQYVFKDGHHEHEEFLGQDGKACKTCSANVTTACGFDLSRAGLEPRSLKQRPHMIQSVCTCHLKVTSPEPDSEPRPLKQRPHDPVRLHLSPESDDWPTT